MNRGAPRPRKVGSISGADIDGEALTPLPRRHCGHQNDLQ
ncbi:hypothetical protein Pd630_LPD01903 [Rhodococcus opacus PD630]|nr:hypothetical protein Pd630_LPD01903 [Rhodococcus opacus PD630]